MYSQTAAPTQTELPPLRHYVAADQKLTADSRQVAAGDAFVACQGEYADGRDYIADAIEQGAAFVYWDEDGGFVWQDEWKVANQPVADLRRRAGLLAAEAYGKVSGSLNIIGVTGTNGKTSITQWLAQAIDLLEQKQSCALIGTVGNGFFGRLAETGHTTPDPVSVQTLLRQFRRQGACHIAMEVSSHGLHQYRVNGVPFRTAVFTNLTRDHLDYHADMAEYGAVKARLFHWQGLQHAVINGDDPFGAALAEELRDTYPQLNTMTYGFADEADIRIAEFAADTRGMRLTLHTPWGKGTVHTRLLGRFNAQNLAACVGVLCAQGWALTAVLAALAQIRPASGRMDCLINEGKPLVVVDYAHTPDALEKALTALNEIRQPESRLWCVFGCGGNRDRGKRPLMGAVAAQHSDCPVITSDNPRMEEPEAIIADILPAVPNAVLVEADRKSAIEQTIARAAPQDIVLIAGKGHETYQDAGGVKTHFSDFETAQEALQRFQAA